MHGEATPQRSMPPAFFGLWLLLGVGLLGLGVLVFGLFLSRTTLQQMGTSILATATLAYLFLQFWITYRAAPVAASLVARPVGAGARTNGHASLGYPPQPHPDGAAKAAVPDLVLFEPVPTLDAVPEATGSQKAQEVLAQTVLAEPRPTPAWPPAAEEPPREAQPDYHAATLERRNAFLKDLPLVEKILNAPPEKPRAPRAPRTLGQCSHCGTRLWAPAKRPIRLRCPRCNHTATLQ